MSVFDPSQMSVIIDGRAITTWGEKGDMLTLTPGAPAGAYTMGSDGKGVFVVDPDKSATLVLNLPQHSADNKWFSQQKAMQQNSIRSFIPKTLEITDLLNGDVVSAQKGYFTELPPYARGTAAKNTVWTLVFETHSSNLAEGFGN